MGVSYRGLLYCSSPSIGSGGTVYIGSEDNNLYAFGPPDETGTITGKVTDFYTRDPEYPNDLGDPISGAAILVLDNEQGTIVEETTTDENGDYSLDLPPDIYTLKASASKYESQVIEDVTVTEGEETTVNFSLKDLLKEYAPILYLHPDEEFYPWGIYSMLNMAELWGDNGKVPAPDGDPPIKPEILKEPETDEDPDYNEDSFYFDLKDYGVYWPFETPTKEVWENDPDYDKNYFVYGRYYEPSDHDDKIVLQYWIFYPFNDWYNNHEGDWEMTQVILEKPEKPTKIENPIKLCCGFHHDGRKHSWDSIKGQNIEETHPQIFAAKGAHGCWATSGIHKLGGWREKVGMNDETSESGKALYPQDPIIEKPSLIPGGTKGKYSYTLTSIGDVTIWAKWKGSWGEKFFSWDELGANGPKSPGKIKYKEESQDKPRWENPIGWCNQLKEGEGPSHSQYITYLKSIIPLLDVDLSMHAYYDEEGLHTGFTETGEIEATIPGTYFYVPSFYSDDQREWMWINTPWDLRFEIKPRSTTSGSPQIKKDSKKPSNLFSNVSQNEGKFDFAFDRYLKEENQNITVIYEDVSFTKNTLATVDVSPENPGFIMEIDLDGDGTIDEIKYPDIIEGVPGISGGSIVINNGEDYTNSREVSLTLSAENAIKMCFSNDNSFWSEWEEYATTKSWSLTSGEGEKRVYVKFKSASEIESDIYSDSIILDTTPPAVSISFPSSELFLFHSFLASTERMCSL